ncbi:MAG: helix-turn-helix domain-containing protein [Bacteroidales bacterium]|nr:helix-turn-helix domain-containing protein [Bacteroidales bacterium]
MAAHGAQAPVPAAQQDELLTSEEACRKLSVSSTTLWRMAQSGLLTPVKVGVQNRYRLSDIAELISKKGGRI